MNHRFFIYPFALLMICTSAPSHAAIGGVGSPNVIVLPTVKASPEEAAAAAQSSARTGPREIMVFKFTKKRINFMPTLRRAIASNKASRKPHRYMLSVTGPKESPRNSLSAQEATDTVRNEMINLGIDGDKIIAYTSSPAGASVSEIRIKQLD